MYLWTLITCILIVLSIREATTVPVLWNLVKNPGWCYVTGFWLIGSILLAIIS